MLHDHQRTYPFLFHLQRKAHPKASHISTSNTIVRYFFTSKLTWLMYLLYLYHVMKHKLHHRCPYLCLISEASLNNHHHIDNHNRKRCLTVLDRMRQVKSLLLFMKFMKFRWQFFIIALSYVNMSKNRCQDHCKR